MAHPAELDPDHAPRAVETSLWRFALVIPEILCGGLLALLILFLVASVFSRYVMDLGWPWSDEVARLLFAWIVLVGFALAVRHRSNVCVDWLLAKLPAGWRRTVWILQDVAVLAFAVFFSWQSWVTVEFSLMQRLPALDITIAWLYASALIAGILMVVYGLANLVDTLQGATPPLHAEISIETARAE